MAPCAEIPMPSKKSSRFPKSVYAPASLPCMHMRMRICMHADLAQIGICRGQESEESHTAGPLRQPRGFVCASRDFGGSTALHGRADAPSSTALWPYQLSSRGRVSHGHCHGLNHGHNPLYLDLCTSFAQLNLHSFPHGTGRRFK